MFSVAAMASAVLYASAVSLLPKKNGETKPPPAVPPPEAQGSGEEGKKQEVEP